MLEPPPAPGPVKDETWSPSLSPTQQKLFNSESKYILCWSEKGTGKTIGVLNKLVKHCYENVNALAIILVQVRAMATKGGAWDKLQQYILPEWKEGLGLDYTDVKLDQQHNEYVWVQNQYGGWSMIVLISAPHPNQLRVRIRGYEPSFVFVDELTSCDSPEYFQAPAAQLGRRPFVEGAQQYVAACNPDSPRHWVHLKWFEENFDPETGKFDTDFEEIYFPKDENVANLTRGYYDHLAKVYRNDPTERDRMLKGVWADRPSGDGLFKDLYLPARHVWPIQEDGQPDYSQQLLPIKGLPVILGMDPGAVHNAFIYEQWPVIGDVSKWLAFDEIVSIKRRIAYEELIPIVMRRMAWWNDTMSEKFNYVWVSDNSAFNQYRAAQGSFDVLEIERIYESNRVKLGLNPMRIRQAPKFAGSRITRVRMVQDLLRSNRLIVSSACHRVQNMLLNLESEKQKDGQPFDPDLAMTPRRSVHLHVFDALTYPMLTGSLSPTALQPAVQGGQMFITVAA